MRHALSRRSFVATVPALAAAPLIARTSRAAIEEGKAPASFPHQDPDLVRGTVGASHGNFARVRELVEASPALAKANWDWGFGDWESALGAAAHTGNRDIALFLIEHGARPTLFSAAMLDQVEVVRAMVEASPGVQRLPGPHGITLMSHARSGKAADVIAYLESVGDADIGPTNEPLTESEQQVYVGEYVYGDGENDRFEVLVKRELLWLQPMGGPSRGMFHHGNHAFHPAGAEAVRIVFTVEGATAVAATVHDPDPIVVARRVVSG